MHRTAVCLGVLLYDIIFTHCLFNLLQLHSPTAFFFGVQNNHLKRCRRLKGIVYIDVDRNHIHSGRVVPSFPRVGFNRLAQLLRRARNNLQLPAHPADGLRRQKPANVSTISTSQLQQRGAPTDISLLGSTNGTYNNHSLNSTRVEVLQATHVKKLLATGNHSEFLSAASLGPSVGNDGEGQQNQSHVIRDLRSNFDGRQAFNTLRKELQQYFAAALCNVPSFVRKTAGTAAAMRAAAHGRLVSLRANRGDDLSLGHFTFDVSAFQSAHPDFLFREVFQTPMFDRMAMTLAAAANVDGVNASNGASALVLFLFLYILHGEVPVVNLSFCCIGIPSWQQTTMFHKSSWTYASCIGKMVDKKRSPAVGRA